MRDGDATKTMATAAANNPLVAAIVVILSLGAVVEFRLRPAGQVQTLEAIGRDVEQINKHVDGLESQIASLQGYVQGKVENLRADMRKDMTEGDAAVREEVMRMLEDLMLRTNRAP